MKIITAIFALISILATSPKIDWRNIFSWLKPDTSAPSHPTPARFIVPAPKSEVKTSIAAATSLGERKDTISIMILGNVMMHSKQLDQDYTTFLRAIAPDMREADLCLANFEFALAGPPYTGYPSFSAPDGFARHLVSDCGVDVILAANNHILDKGPKGLNRTLQVFDNLCDSLRVAYTGIAANKDGVKPLICVRRGLRIAFVNFTYGTNYEQTSQFPTVFQMDSSLVQKLIQDAKAQGADYIIALPHWGIEYKLTHSAKQEKWAKWLISWGGVDAIVGSHPHVIQDYEEIDGVPVFYSLGNIVSNMSAANTQDGLAVTLRFETDHHTGTSRMLPAETRRAYCQLPSHEVVWK